MAYKKGQSGNPAGRKPGSKNKRTVIAEQDLKTGLGGIGKVVAEYVSGAGGHSLAQDLNDNELTARDRLLIMEKYAQYAYPKMQSVSAGVSIQNEAVRTIGERLAELAGDGDEQ